MSLLRPSAVQVKDVDTYPWTVLAVSSVSQPGEWMFCGKNLLTGDRLPSARTYEEAERYLKALFVEGKKDRAKAEGDELLDTIVVDTHTRH